MHRWDSATGTLRLFLPALHPIQMIDGLDCDKTFATCEIKFDNAVSLPTAVAAQINVSIVERHGTCEIETLGQLAAQLAQAIDFSSGLQAFGNYRHAKHFGQFKDGCDDGLVFLPFGHGPDQRTIDLDDIEGESSEIAEARIAGAEIIYRQCTGLQK
jgi:hypothetical protein